MSRTTSARRWHLLLLAGLACLLTSQVGLMQSPIIHNYRPPQIGTPEEKSEAEATTRAFPPSNPVNESPATRQIVTMGPPVHQSIFFFDIPKSDSSETLLFETALPREKQQVLEFGWLPTSRFPDEPRLAPDSPLLMGQTPRPRLALVPLLPIPPKREPDAHRMPHLPADVVFADLDEPVVELRIENLRVHFLSPRGLSRGNPAFRRVVGLAVPEVPNWSSVSAKLAKPARTEPEPYASFGVPVLKAFPRR